jgi:superfamily II DNA or RNA helicase
VTTPFHAKYWAHSLLLSRPPSGPEALSRSIGNARVDLNPHQVDAALFALRSPYSRGALLADEVGLGKTIEAALILAQRWAERRRKILLIVPATLRKQWQLELEDKFFLPSVILETKSANDLMKKGSANPFDLDDQIAIASYQFVYSKRELVKAVGWDLVVIDEAHRLRNIWRGTKTHEAIVDSVSRAGRKLLLTATPLQNSLKELYGLVSIIDPDLFGSEDAFDAQFMDTDDPEGRDNALRDRIKHICKRTLRRDVLEYISFTNRYTHTADFVPSAAETQLYDEVSAYLQREVLAALPNTRRKLITLILRKLLASSSRAIGATLSKFVSRLSEPAPAPAEDEAVADFDALEELEEEWGDDAGEAAPPAADVDAELADLKRFVELANSIPRDSKATKLIEVLPIAFEEAGKRGAKRKAVIFTESRKTQDYLFQLLSDNGFAGEIVLMNGTNTDDVSKAIYGRWKERHKDRWADITSGSKSADMKAAIVEEFRDHATILLATESAAEGVNLQFCSLVVNYDLPWNPQRIEQRIGRCHRYGQKSDVLVVNFLNRTNEADRRVFELLDQKFNLFRGVFGASDDVLGVVESGVDLEKRIAEIMQDCRTPEEIKAAFDALQAELDEKIKAGIANARRAFLENFDAEVHERLKVHKEAAKQSLDRHQGMLFDLARFELGAAATFDEHEPSFSLRRDDALLRFNLDWQQAEARNELFFRVGHPVAEDILSRAVERPTPPSEVTLVYDAAAAALEPYRGKSGWLELGKLRADSVGRIEEHLLVAACLDDGTALDAEVAAKLFSFRASAGGVLGVPPPAALASIRDALKTELVSEIEARSEEYFGEEAEKIERRSEDLTVGLDREIKKLGKDIAAAQREARKARGLQEKLEAQKAVRALESRRDAKRRQFYEEQDRIKADHDKLITDLERQLAAKKVEVEPIFAVRWHLVGESALSVLDRSPGGRLFTTAEEVDEHVRRERDAWER